MYRSRLEKDLKRWAGLGLVSEASVTAMLGEFDQRESSFSLGRVLVMIAALLLSAAVLLLVAANWEGISRPARVGLILSVIWIGYGAGAAFRMRGWSLVSQAALVIATLSFGGAIALIGQMYHLSGDAADAMALWFAVAVLATFLTRAPALATVAAFLLAALFATLVFDDATIAFAGDGAWYVPVGIVLVIALVRYTGAARTRHVAYLTLLAWFGWLYMEVDALSLAIAYAGLGFIGFCLCVLTRSPLARLAETAGAAPAFYAYLLGALGLFGLQISTPVFDPAASALVANIVIGVLTLAFALAGIVLAGRSNGAVRYLAYLIFAAECLYLASETIGSILGTSGFFLISGVVVAVIAWLVIQIERRLKRAEKGVSA
ncbi:Uncharacterized membrane protein [Rhizobium sp. RU20A]|uniref:DUF2157 domain-containing protein n=1 Tax=Rhizobium sp. RU20A TaxID=1907412 RepID=UPI000953A377|nr:DUF2157 domain-containing protein [Rhizobium sp. RU20A]SIQ02278.1 Uncharacterized membrane protein [Rhizobium sp. RU20A]